MLHTHIAASLAHPFADWLTGDIQQNTNCLFCGFGRVKYFLKLLLSPVATLRSFCGPCNKYTPSTRMHTHFHISVHSKYIAYGCDERQYNEKYKSAKRSLLVKIDTVVSFHFRCECDTMRFDTSTNGQTGPTNVVCAPYILHILPPSADTARGRQAANGRRAGGKGGGGRWGGKARREWTSNILQNSNVGCGVAFRLLLHDAISI